MSRKIHLPDTVFVSDECVDDALTKRVLARLPEALVRVVSDNRDPVTETAYAVEKIGIPTELSPAEKFSVGKKKMLLTRYHGTWLRSCPGTSKHVCCNLWIVNPGEGCPMDCSYCYLQNYLLRNPAMKLYTNISDMLAAIERAAVDSPNRLFRIGTGEVMDSLIWDDLTDLTHELIPLFARIPNLTLELKTKSDCVQNLLDLRTEHNEKTVVSWSVNARQVTDRDEAFTASFDERIHAAKAVVDAGYRVGFHFDPLIHFDGWQDGYREAVRDIFAQIPSSRVAWVSVSTLRYRPEMKAVMRERFPKSRISFGEQFRGKDDKLRYFQPIRFQLEEFVWKLLHEVRKDMPVYLCMESSTAWKKIAGGAPVAGSELAEVFSRRGTLPIVDSHL